MFTSIQHVVLALILSCWGTGSDMRLHCAKAYMYYIRMPMCQGCLRERWRQSGFLANVRLNLDPIHLFWGFLEWHALEHQQHLHG